jgi:hypothetical protein
MCDKFDRSEAIFMNAMHRKESQNCAVLAGGAASVQSYMPRNWVGIPLIVNEFSMAFFSPCEQKPG